MNNKSHNSHRDRQAQAAYSAAPLFESLESRQLMSAAPSLGPVAKMHAGASVPATHAPLVATAAAVKAKVTSVVPGKGVVVPPAGGVTVEAKSLWGHIKGAAKWVKDHVVIGLHNIGIKGSF